MGTCSAAVWCFTSTFCSCSPSLLKFSQIFKDATLFFSHATPNLPTVIPSMDHIDTHLATASNNPRLSPALRASLALSKVHLNKYYALTDHTKVYWIAMSESIPPIIVRISILRNSLTSATQTSILPWGCLNQWMDLHHKYNCPWRVCPSICGPPHWRGHCHFLPRSKSLAKSLHSLVQIRYYVHKA